MDQVTKEVLEAMVPEEDPMGSRNLHCSMHSQLSNIVKFPIWVQKLAAGVRNMVGTYVLPNGSCSGLRLVFLKWANQVSMGQAE